jgi:lipid-binding SYLF domain-containing protein
MMTGTFAARAQSDLKTAADQTIAQFKQADPGLQTFFDSSAGYAVFPSVGKGGLIIGGERGKGLVYEHGIPVGEVTMTEASIGAQAGGASFAQVIFFQTPDVLQQFKQSKYLMDAQISGVIAAQGAEQHARYEKGVAVFVLPKKGLMGQAAVGGQKFKFTPYTQQ